MDDVTSAAEIQQIGPISRITASPALQNHGRAQNDVKLSLMFAVLHSQFSSALCINFRAVGCSGRSKFSLRGVPRCSNLDMLFGCSNYCAKCFRRSLKPCLKLRPVCYRKRISPKSTLIGLAVCGGWKIGQCATVPHPPLFIRNSRTTSGSRKCEYVCCGGCKTISVEKRQLWDGRRLLNFPALLPHLEAVAHLHDSDAVVHCVRCWLLPSRKISKKVIMEFFRTIK